MIKQRDKSIFENLFVLELANNHLGSVDRGLRIIRDHATVVRYNNVRAAIKLQFRDVEEFIHPEFKGNTELRYVRKTEDTKLSKSDFAILVEEIRKVSCIPMATPFDEGSVDLCVEFDFPIIKIASSDVNDWPLLEKAASTRRPVIVSSGGASEKDLDDIVNFFGKRDIPLAINHCVSLYPSEDSELDLDQIDFLHARYPDHVIGLSTHEHRDWHSSMLISYAKGARSWERHVDVSSDGAAVSPYCSLPEQCDVWFKAFKKAREMCGGVGASRRVISQRETDYLSTLVRVRPPRPRARLSVLEGGVRARFLPGHPFAKGPALLPGGDERRAAGHADQSARPAHDRPYQRPLSRKRILSGIDHKPGDLVDPASQAGPAITLERHPRQATDYPP